MEGLIPNVYKIVTRYKKGQAAGAPDETPPVTYAHLTPSESAKYLMSALPPPDPANSSAPPKSRVGLHNANPAGRKAAAPPRRRSRMG